MQENEYVFAEDLLIPSETAPTGNFRPELMLKMREHYLRVFDLQHMRPNRRIYISRAGTARRRLVNEQGLQPLFQEFGFETIRLEDYPFEEQVKICRSAEVLAGVHGAGLVNMLFLHESAKVLEIRNADDRQNLCYFSLADALNLPYFYYRAKPVDGADNHADLMAEPEGLQKVFSEMFSVPDI